MEARPGVGGEALGPRAGTGDAAVTCRAASRPSPIVAACLARG